MSGLKLVIGFLLMWVMAINMGCNKGEEIRKYKEMKHTSPSANQETHNGMTTPAIPLENTQKTIEEHFTWQTPMDWQEEKNTSSIRLATFTISSGENLATCTIVPFQGEAGGLKANISRWLGQLTGNNNHMDAMLTEGDPAKVEELLNKTEPFQTIGKLPAQLVDFTKVTENAGDPSILATVIKVGDSSIFIKLTGPKHVLVANKTKFKSLCASFAIKTPSPDMTNTPQ